MVRNDTRLQSQTEIVQAMAEGFPHHVESALWVACTKVDVGILRSWTDTWRTEMDRTADVRGFKAQVAILYITSNVVSRNRGNALGLAGKGPFHMFNAEQVLEDTDCSSFRYAPGGL